MDGAAEAAVGQQFGALSLEGSDAMDTAMGLSPGSELKHQALLPGWAPTADAPPSQILGEDAPTPTGAELAEVFARYTEAAMGLAQNHQGSDAEDADMALAALGAAVAGGGARPREQVVQELHSQVGGVLHAYHVGFVLTGRHRSSCVWARFSWRTCAVGPLGVLWMQTRWLRQGVLQQCWGGVVVVLGTSAGLLSRLQELHSQVGGVLHALAASALCDDQ